MGEPEERAARSGHRIVAAGTEWVTPPDAAECEPAPAQRPVAFERFDGVRGAAGIITACGREKMPERDLVSPHTQNEKSAH